MRRLETSLLLALSIGFGCGPRGVTEARRPAPAAASAKVSRPAIPSLSSVRLAVLPAGTSGPYLGYGSEGGLVVWDQPETAELGSWRVQAITEDGRPRGRVLRVADAPSRLGLVAVRAAGPLRPRSGASQSAPGFLVVSSEQRGELAGLQAMLIGTSAELVGGPTRLEERAEAVLWVEALPTQTGSLVLWAKRTNKTAELAAAALNARAERISGPHVLARDVLAWQAVGGSGSTAAWVGVVSAEKPPTGSVNLLAVDTNGQTVGSPRVVSASPTANADLDVARVGDRLLVGWSDVREIEPRIYLASLDLGGVIRSPAAPATASLDEESLVRIVSPMDQGSSAYLAWEDLTDRPEQGRSIRLAPIGADGRVGAARALLRMEEVGQLPELAATRQGLAALTVAPVCLRTGSCDTTEIAPTFVELDHDLEVIASEPIRLDAVSGKAASAAWGLTCRTRGCSALAAMPESPAPVFLVTPVARSRAWQPAGGPLATDEPPRVTALETLTITDPLSGISAARTPTATLAAWVTYFDPAAPLERPKKPAPDGRMEAVRALLQVQAFPDAQGAPLPIQTISYRARSLGRVALVPGETARDQALLVWSALDYGEPEVFLTLLSSGGKKVAQRVLTHNRASVGDVAAVRVTDGWVVSWVDDRRGECVVRAAKVDERLGRVGPERRLTAFKGAATGLRLLAQEQRVYAVWADARNPKRPGWADIYGAMLKSSDASPLGEARALEVTVPHSYSPVLGNTDDGVVLGWIEEGGEQQPEGAKVELVRLDQDGQPVSQRAVIRTNGTPTALDLDCAGKLCRGLVSVDQGARGALEAFVYPQAAPSKPKRIALLGGPGGQSVALSLIGRQLFYSDQTGEGRGRVRRLRIEW